MQRDSRIDDYIAKAAPFAQPILRHMRALVHSAVPGLEETIKWSMPHFLFGGKNLAGMAGFKAYCALTIHGEGRQGMAENAAMGQFGKITQISDLTDESVIAARLQAAAARIAEGGTAVKTRSGAPKVAKAEIPVPDDLAAALIANPAAKTTLDTLAPSHRREYLEWIVGAKRVETREKRIATAIAQLSEGKKRNWKYENC